MKKCSKCKVIKPSDKFYKCKRTSNGLQSWCKSCKSAKASSGEAKVYQREYRERIKQTEKTLPANKTCPVCGEKKSASQFHKSKRNRDGLVSRCKECKRADAASYRKTDRGKKKKREWNNTAKGKKYIEKMRRLYRRKHPNRYAANNAVNNAVQAGRLPPISTQLCGCGKKAIHYHHHKGYDKKHWLDVQPLCGRCHYEESN